MDEYRVSKHPIPGRINNAGVGYIYIPPDVDDINKFINKCFNTGTISILTSDSSRYDGVRVSKSIFDDLEFPNETGELGSMVFWIAYPKHKLPIVVAVINKLGEVLSIQNGQFKKEKRTDNGFVGIFGDANKGNLLFNIESNVDGGGNLHISVKNKKGNGGQVHITTDSDINVISNTKITAQSTEEIHVKVENPSRNILAEVNINSRGLFDVKNQNISLEELFSELATACGNITTATSIGTQPVINKPSFLQFVNVTLKKFFQ